jgi:hypothetical protein
MELNRLVSDNIQGIPKNIEFVRNKFLKITCSDKTQLNLLAQKRSFGTYAIEIDVQERREKLSYCFIYGIDKDVGIEELKATIEPKPVVIYRMKRKGQDADYIKAGYTTPSPPRKVKIGLLSYNTTDVSNRPPLCAYCRRIGHTKTVCKATKPACPKCAGEHEYHDCQQKDSPHSLCSNCGGPHSAAYGGCPAIKSYAAVTAIQKKDNISRPAAKQRYSESNPVIPIPPPRTQLHLQPPPPRSFTDGEATYTKLDQPALEAKIHSSIEEVFATETIMPRVFGMCLAIHEISDKGYLSRQFTAPLEYAMKKVLGKEQAELWYAPVMKYKQLAFKSFTAYTKQYHIEPICAPLKTQQEAEDTASEVDG